MSEGMIGSQGQSLRRRRLRCCEPGCFIARGQADREIGLNLRHASQRFDIGGIEGQRALKETARLVQAFERELLG